MLWKVLVPIQKLHPNFYPLGLWVPAHHPLFVRELEYHGRQVTAPTQILVLVTTGMPEHSPLKVGVVSQAAVLNNALSLDSRCPGAYEAGH